MATRTERDAVVAARCENCRIRLRDEGVERHGRRYCCDGCAEGGPCRC